MKTTEAVSNNTAVAARPNTPGAGVDPRKVVKPGKRLRNWHRKSVAKTSMIRFARDLAAGSSKHDATIAMAWLNSKGARR